MEFFHGFSGWMRWNCVQYTIVQFRADGPSGPEGAFDRIFTHTTGFAEFDELRARLQLRKAELLVTLEHSEAPLNTNSSEREVRDPVTIRKISGSTRSEDGRRCRDTFLSLKKTCQKNAISFWAFLGDRLGITVHGIAHLPDLIRQRAAPKPV